jgi:hypothetical protein
MIEAFGELLEWGLVAVAGWRFLLSPAFRKALRAEWKSEHPLYVVWDVCGGLAGIAISLLLVYLIYGAMY